MSVWQQGLPAYLLTWFKRPGFWLGLFELILTYTLMF